MRTDNLVFLEVIEWFDETGKELVHRIPEKGSGEVKFGAQLIVRDSQAGIFFYKGRACDAFGPGNNLGEIIAEYLAGVAASLIQQGYQPSLSSL